MFDYVLYPNPYVVVTPKGYSKHYYAQGRKEWRRVLEGVACQMRLLLA